MWDTHLEQKQLAFARQEQILRTEAKAFDGGTQKAHAPDNRGLAGYSQKLGKHQPCQKGLRERITQILESSPLAEGRFALDREAGE